MTADVAQMTAFMSSEGTDPEVSNEISKVIMEVHKAYFGDSYVPLTIRYGIAQEVQRRLNVTRKE